MNSIERAEHRVWPGERSAARHILLIGVDGARWELVPAEGRIRALAAEGSWHAMTMEAPTISAPGWPVLVDPQGLGPVIHPRVEQQYAGLHNVIVRDGETHGYERIDAEITAVTLAKLRAAAFDVGFMYFCDADDAGHVHGLVEGTGYGDALSRIDAHVSRIVDAVTHRAQTLGEDWLVVLTTDHGHLDEGGHGGDDPRERESWVVAWSPTGELPDWPDEIIPSQLCGMLLDARYTNR